jgi:hypothetical protein
MRTTVTILCYCSETKAASSSIAFIPVVPPCLNITLQCSDTPTVQLTAFHSFPQPRMINP